MTKDEALKMALEALNDLATWNDGEVGSHMDEPYAAEVARLTITAIKEALAQPEQEPVAWMNDMGTHIDLNVSGRGMPLYTTPPQRKPLTDEEIAEFAERMEASDPTDSFWREFARAIEEALAQPEQEPVAWKLVPIEPTNEMLKAMDECSTEGYDERLYAGHAASVYMAAIDAAPAQSAQQKPVVWMYQDKSTHEVRFQKNMRDFVDHSKTSEVPLYSESLANHELQCVCGAVWCGDEMVHTPNKSPPQRKPLSDEEIILIVADCASSHQHTDIHFARAIEAAHSIKGEA